jgi:organic hydroperoxide reductase OsmC/OhrA
MSEYYAKIIWERRAEENYVDRKYSRAHRWEFDGGTTVPASPSPHVVPQPMSNPAGVDPEEAFVASLSSCHMLFFLELAAKKRFVIDKYEDDAIGILAENSDGKTAMTKVTLRPLVIFSGERQPTQEQIEQLHHQSHELCFIANSVKTEVVTEIRKESL